NDPWRQRIFYIILLRDVALKHRPIVHLIY
ncbi:hypothetical protein X975_25387, partial [Stegodyphus mimosarum]